MKFEGRLLEALKNKKIILFAGAGVGQAAGLYGSEKLRDYIFDKAKELNYSEKNDRPLERLTSSLQHNPLFGRAWLTRIVSEYFCKPAIYVNLESHTKLLQLNCLDSIFTTNYDIAFEQAASRASLDLRVRALDSVSAANTHLLEETINCYKLHGCADKVTSDPSHAKPLVLSRRDWGLANANRREILRELTAKVNAGCVVIFVGFNLSNGDNTDVARAVFEGNEDILRTDIWHSNACFALVRNPSEEDKKIYMEDYSCEIVQGDFSSFVTGLENASVEINNDNDSPSNADIEAKVSFLSLKCNRRYTRRFLEDNSDNYLVWHDNTLSDIEKEECNIESWHEPASLKMLANERYIQRDILNDVLRETTNVVKSIAENRRNDVITIVGERGAGKSVILLQLAKYCYEELCQPVIFLKESAFFEVESKNDSSLLVQGWDGKALDIILQPFFDEQSSVPILIADNQPHRRAKAEQLASYLSNHGKSCLLIVADYISSDNKFSFNNCIQIPNKLSNRDIDLLFDQLSLDRREMFGKRIELLNRARNQCNKDILIIMYEWLDERFRPFQKIISDCADLISKSNILRQVYILIATFHVAGYKPSLSLIIRAAGYPADDVLKYLNAGDFGLRLSSDSLVLYRHTLISSSLLEAMGVVPLDQRKSIISCINHAGASDVRFFKDFLDYLFSLGNPAFSIDDMEAIKAATECNSVFDNEWDLHHKYAAFLTRDSQDINYYQEARRYCDKALELAVDDNNCSSIYHTLGNIEYKQYQLSYLEEPELAQGCFDRAVDKFEQSKQLRTIQTEHAYVTHIDFINFQLEHTKDNDVVIGNSQRSELQASKFATYWEALKVVDKDQQRYLSDRVRKEGPPLWENLPEKVRIHIKKNAFINNPNKILFDCYIDQCLKEQSISSRNEIFKIYTLHSKVRDPDILVPLIEGMKRTFLLNASSRSAILRTIASELFDPISPIANLTRARGIRLLAIDSFAAGQYDYLAKHVLSNAAALYQEIRPSFLAAEYVLPKEYNDVAGLDNEKAQKLFVNMGPNCFYNIKSAAIMEKRFYRRQNAGQASPKYTKLSSPSFGKFLLKVPSVEITNSRNSFVANCIVSYTPYGMSGNLQRPSSK